MCGTTDIVDVVFNVRGDSVHIGYQYQWYAAVKAVDHELTQVPQLRFGPLERVRYAGDGLMTIFERRTAWRVRTPWRHLKRVLQLDGVRLEVGWHIVDLINPVIIPPQPSPTLHAEMVAWRSRKFSGNRNPTLTEFVGYTWRRLRDDHGVKDGQPMMVGKRRAIHIKGNEQIGYPLELRDLTNEQSLSLQSAGLGGRKRFGCGLFVHGKMPKWAASATTSDVP